MENKMVHFDDIFSECRRKPHGFYIYRERSLRPGHGEIV